METCESCYFWDSDDAIWNSIGNHSCRRFPERMEKSKDDWCGEHKDKINIPSYKIEVPIGGLKGEL